MNRKSKAKVACVTDTWTNLCKRLDVVQAKVALRDWAWENADLLRGVSDQYYVIMMQN